MEDIPSQSNDFLKALESNAEENIASLLGQPQSGADSSETSFLAPFSFFGNADAADSESEFLRMPNLFKIPVTPSKFLTADDTTARKALHIRFWNGKDHTTPYAQPETDRVALKVLASEDLDAFKELYKKRSKGQHKLLGTWSVSNATRHAYSWTLAMSPDPDKPRHSLSVAEPEPVWMVRFSVSLNRESSMYEENPSLIEKVEKAFNELAILPEINHFRNTIPLGVCFSVKLDTPQRFPKKKMFFLAHVDVLYYPLPNSPPVILYQATRDFSFRPPGPIHSIGLKRKSSALSPSSPNPLGSASPNAKAQRREESPPMVERASASGLDVTEWAFPEHTTVPSLFCFSLKISTVKGVQVWARGNGGKYREVKTPLVYRISPKTGESTAKVVLGRGKDCDVILASKDPQKIEFLSRHHVSFAPSLPKATTSMAVGIPGGLTVTPLGRNPFRVNDALVNSSNDPAFVAFNDPSAELRLGCNVRVKVDLEHPPDATAGQVIELSVSHLKLED